MADITLIREAIIKNRGGHEQTSDAGIMFLFNSLPQETRDQYLESVEHKTDSVKRKTKTESL